MNHEETTQIDDSTPEAPVDVQPPADDPLATAQKQAKEYFEGWQRERADFSNYKRRVEREMKDIHSSATNHTLTALLPVIDDFERALSSLPEDLRGNAWIDGVLAIQRKFQKVLDDFGLVVIDPVGQPFDPSRHEAIATDTAADVPTGHVTVTLQKGYLSGDRVLRPALVRVAG
ncbi:MAG: nucleotide exchange factor GrpE [Anaerolineae bacterium]|nr:nucleotide exchange factor GrpE [Anaerolineae bacterium]